jgi:carboxyl-terminal processing protease
MHKMKLLRTSFYILFLFISSNLSSQVTEGTLKLGEVLDKVSKYYVDTINEKALVDKMITDMLHDLDPHSNYIKKEDVVTVQEELDGGFEGIGVSFNMLNDTLFIINPISGGPSEKVGILPGDRIILVNNENIAGVDMKTIDIQKRLKGPKGTKVQISVSRKGEASLIDFVITRDKIPIYSLDAAYMINENIGYIKIARFSNTTIPEFREALKDLNEEGMQDLVLDLTGNGGGYLYAAITLADEFLNGRRLLLYTQGAKNPRRNYYSSDRGGFTEGKVVVLIDELSASASEIVSGALQDWDRAVIVGRRSFGKGLVQARLELKDGSELRLTIAKYYTPSGRLIQKSYKEGYDEYSKELLKRYNNGEYLSADSISFPDSLKFYTMEKKRVVYGGGGIMPDFFIPVDTSDNSDYYRSLIRKGIMNQFILSYLDGTRKELEKAYTDFDSFNNGFEVSEEMLNALIAYAEDEGLEYKHEDFEKSKDYIKHVFKAYMARDLWNSSEFYQIFNQKNDMLDKAIEIVGSDKMYEGMLQSPGKSEQ